MRGLVAVQFVLAFSLLSCSSGGDGSPVTDVAAEGPSEADTKEIASRQDTQVQGDLSQEVAPTDVPWEELPTLPTDRTFAGRYAAGAATRVLNPDHDVFLGGFGLCQGNAAMCRYSQGVHDDLRVSALALADVQSGEVVIFVGMDSVGLLLHDQKLIHEAVPGAFRAKYGVRLEGERVVVGESHTHHAPDTVGLYGTMLEPQREEEAYIALLRQTVVEVALEAFGNLEDAELDWATASAPNTSKDKCASDTTVWTLRARKPGGGNTLGTMTRWVAHPTVYWDQNNGISADYVGTFRARMEAETGAIAVYFNGPIGSVYAQELAPCAEGDAFPEGWQDPDLSNSDHGAVACVGDNVASSALQALGAQATPIGDAGIRFHHRSFQFHPTNLILMMVIDTPSIPGDGVDVKDPTTTWTSEFSWITVGNLNFVTTPGEAFPCFAKHIVETLEEASLTNPIVLGVTQDWMGYLLSADQWADEALAYHRGLSPGETVEPAYLSALQELIQAGE